MASRWNTHCYWIMMHSDSLPAWFITFLLLAGLGFMCQAADAPLPDFEVHYNLRYENLRVGEAVYRLERRDDGFHYESRSQPVGITAWLRKDRVHERSWWTWHDGHIRPLQYHYQRTGGRTDRNAELIFDWQELRVENRVEGHPWQMDIPAHALDKMVVTLALMRDLENGARDVEYAIADGGTLKTYRFRVVGEETVETPAGTFETVKLERLREDSQRYTALWCAPDLHYLPVKLLQRESDDRLVTSELRSVSDSLRRVPPSDER